MAMARSSPFLTYEPHPCLDRRVTSVFPIFHLQNEKVICAMLVLPTVPSWGWHGKDGSYSFQLVEV